MLRKICTVTLAIISGYATAEGGIPLKDVSSTLLVGGNILTKLVWAACIVVGVMLIAAAFTQFQIHRRNPKLVPLTTPVMYLLLGIAAIALPFIKQVSTFIDGKPINANKPAYQAPSTTNSGTTNSVPQPPTAVPFDPNDIDRPY